MQSSKLAVQCVQFTAHARTQARCACCRNNGTQCAGVQWTISNATTQLYSFEDLTAQSSRRIFTFAPGSVTIPSTLSFTINYWWPGVHLNHIMLWIRTRGC